MSIPSSKLLPSGVWSAVDDPSQSLEEGVSGLSSLDQLLVSALLEDLGSLERLAEVAPRAWLILVCQQAGDVGVSLTLSQIARVIGKSKTAAHRLVDSLVDAGTLQRHKSGLRCQLSLSFSQRLGDRPAERQPERSPERRLGSRGFTKPRFPSDLQLEAPVQTERQRNAPRNGQRTALRNGPRASAESGAFTRTPERLTECERNAPTPSKHPFFNGLRSGTAQAAERQRNAQRNGPGDASRQRNGCKQVKPLQESHLADSPKHETERPLPSPPPPPKRLIKIKEGGGGKGGCGDESTTAVETVWELYAAKRRECLEGLGLNAKQETLTATRRRRITGLLVEKGPEPLLEAIARLHRSDWHLGEGRFEGQPHRLFAESVFSANEKADQIEILRHLDDGPALWESRPMSLEQRRLQAPLLAHRQMELPEVDYENNRAELIERIPQQLGDLRRQIAALDLSDLEQVEDRLADLQNSTVEAHRDEAEEEIHELRQGGFYRRCSPEAQENIERQAIRQKIGLPVLSVVI